MPNASNVKIETLGSQVEKLVIDHSMTTRRKCTIINDLDATIDAAINLQTEVDAQAQIIEVFTKKDLKLLEAVQQKNFDQFREQITLGANVNVKDGDGQSLLHLSITNGDMGIFGYLIQQSPNIDARNKLNQTPLHLAVMKEQFDTVFLLLEPGCNLRVKDNDKREPIDLANIRQLENIRTLIAEYGPVTYKLNVHHQVFAAPSTVAVGARICDICIDLPVNCLCLPCGHVFCERCIKSWILQVATCPHCKVKITDLKPLYY